MKILVISGSFFPHISPRSFRTTELAKELSRRGNDVTLLIPESEYDLSSFISENKLSFKSYKRKLEKRRFVGNHFIDKVLFHYLHQFLMYPSLGNMKLLEKKACCETGYDLLITIAVPHFIPWAVGNLYAQGKTIAPIWISDCGDPFMLSGSVKQRPPFWFKVLEKRWCHMCSYISVPTESSYLGYYPEFKDKIRVIPQGFNLEEISIPEYKKNSVPTFAFAGGFIPQKRDPKKLLDFLLKLDRPFRFVAYGNNVQLFLEPYKRKLGEKLIIEKPVPRNDLLPILAQMDFLINIGNSTKVQTPSKLIDYALTGRPYLTIESDDIKEEVLLEFLDGNYEHADPKIDLNKYDIHNVAQQFLDLCATRA